MSVILTPLQQIREWFDFIDVKAEGFEGCFGFAVPSKAALRHHPNWPAAARPENGRAAAGCGWTREEALTSGLGEAAELASVCVWGDEPLIHATAAELGSAAWLALDIHSFEEKELKDRERWNDSPFGALDWRPPEYDPANVIDWIRAERQDGDEVFIPADLDLVGRRAPHDREVVGIATTSGCAAGSTIKMAKERAVAELMERDAIGLWWYSRAFASALSTNVLKSDPDMRTFLEGRSRKLSLLDISTDLYRHVVVAASWDAAGEKVALGFGANKRQETAARSAILEMLQAEIGVLQRLRNRDGLCQLWIAKVNSTAPQFNELTPSRPTLVQEKPTCAFIDHTRPELSVPVFRAVVCGLATDKPRFGSPRYKNFGLRDTIPLLV